MGLFSKKNSGNKKPPVRLNSGAKADIKVLGSGCKACHQLYDNALKAFEGTDIKVEYITDMQKIAEYGVMSMPALVQNGKVVSAGRILKPADIAKLINPQN